MTRFDVSVDLSWLSERDSAVEIMINGQKAVLLTHNMLMACIENICDYEGSSIPRRISAYDANKSKCYSERRSV